MLLLIILEPFLDYGIYIRDIIATLITITIMIICDDDNDIIIAL